MSNYNLIIGSHVNVSGSEMLLGSTKDALSYGANTFMFYTGAPQNTIRKPISSFKVKEAKELMEANGIDIKNVVIHAPYIINLANIKDPNDNFPVKFLKEELKRVAQIGCIYLVLHPGSAVKKTKEEGLQSIVDNLNLTLEDDDSNVVILLESMAGKGSELGSTMEELKFILDNVKKKERLGVCLDSCHLSDSGYDLTKIDEFLDKFDQIVGLDKVKVFHINDSKNPLGSHKDRHENFGFGNLGFQTLINIIYHPKLESVIKILETPFVGDLPPYKEEIQMIKNKSFNDKMVEELLVRQGK